MKIELNLIKGILLIVLSCAFNTVESQNSPTCELKVEYEVDKIGDSASLVSVKPLDGIPPYKYLFFEEETGKLLQKDMSKSSVSISSKGKYFFIVVDKNNCNKKIQFSIQ